MRFSIKEPRSRADQEAISISLDSLAHKHRLHPLPRHVSRETTFNADASVLVFRQIQQDKRKAQGFPWAFLCNSTFV